MIDIQEKKTQIIKFLKENGPSLPVQVSREIKMDPVFASAILSELLQSKQIKTSHMRVGSSPLYLIQGTENLLENHTENLKSIEREVQEKLKKEKIILDETQAPATRVALRAIKDFAIPFKFQEKIHWKYAFTPEEEVEKILKAPEEEEEESAEEIIEESEEETPNRNTETPKHRNTPSESEKDSKKVEQIFEKETNPKENKKDSKPKTFLEEIENFLETKNAQISSIEEVDKKKLIATIEKDNKKSMLFAFNKLRINESELLKCYKDAKKENLPYQIITKGDLTKKLQETIDAYQKLQAHFKLED